MGKGFIYLICLVFAVGCLKTNENATISKNKELSSQIMHTHDSSMQYNEYLMKLKRMINQKLDSIENNTLKDSLIKISGQLYIADKKMLDWMHQYKEPNLSHDSAYNYLICQKQLIDEVHNLTFEAKNNAEKILNIK